MAHNELSHDFCPATALLFFPMLAVSNQLIHCGVFASVQTVCLLARHRVKCVHQAFVFAVVLCGFTTLNIRVLGVLCMSSALSLTTSCSYPFSLPLPPLLRLPFFAFPSSHITPRSLAIHSLRRCHWPFSSIFLSSISRSQSVFPYLPILYPAYIYTLCFFPHPLAHFCFPFLSSRCSHFAGYAIPATCACHQICLNALARFRRFCIERTTQHQCVF